MPSLIVVTSVLVENVALRVKSMAEQPPYVELERSLAVVLIVDVIVRGDREAGLKPLSWIGRPTRWVVGVHIGVELVLGVVVVDVDVDVDVETELERTLMKSGEELLLVDVECRRRRWRRCRTELARRGMRTKRTALALKKSGELALDVGVDIDEEEECAIGMRIKNVSAHKDCGIQSPTKPQNRRSAIRTLTFLTRIR